jgi:uncharacterized RDD family membrane protein YckC
MADHRRDHVRTIRTPEGIMFSYTLAGPVMRAIAWLVDQAIIATAYYILMQLAMPMMLAGMLGDMVIAIVSIGFFIFTFAYYIVQEWLWRGQTIGKRLLRLRVMDEQGLRLQFSQVVLRNLFRVVDGLPFLYTVGGIACLLSRHAQRLGDFAANTIVVRTPRTAQPDLSRVLADKYNSFREHPHLEARLRKRVTPDEARLALQALVRRDRLDADARVDLYRDLADHFRGLADFPEEATFGLTDEQYIRNVVDLLYRTR